MDQASRQTWDRRELLGAGAALSALLMLSFYVVFGWEINLRSVAASSVAALIAILLFLIAGRRLASFLAPVSGVVVLTQLANVDEMPFPLWLEVLLLCALFLSGGMFLIEMFFAPKDVPAEPSE